MYAASAGRDKKLCVWDMETQEVVQQVGTQDVVTCIAWHPAANELAMTCEDESWATWKGVVAGQRGPHLCHEQLQKLEDQGAAATAAAATA